MASPAFENFARGRGLIKASFGMALAALISVGTHTKAEAATEWMDGTSQWSVGFMEDGPNSYCTLLWNSNTGRTVEFRQGLKTADWRLSDSQWNFPDGTSTKISMAGPRNVMTIAALAEGKTNLSVSDHGNVVRAIIRNSIAGTIDLDLSVGDQGEDWEIPISRIYSMHSGVTRCMHRLYAHAVTKQPNDAPATGF